MGVKRDRNLFALWLAALVLCWLTPALAEGPGAGRGPAVKPVSLESGILLQSSADSTQVAINLSRRAGFTHRLVSARPGKPSEIVIEGRSWGFPRIRSLVKGDRLVHSVTLRKEKRGSSMRIGLLQPVSYQIEWIEDLSQLLVTIHPQRGAAGLGPPLLRPVADRAPAQRSRLALQGSPPSQATVLAQAAGSQEQKGIDVTADSLSVREGKIVEGKGNVEIRREETLIKADQVRVNQETQDVEARGKVSVDDPEWRLKAEAVQMNLEKETGAIEQGEIFLEKGHLSLSGGRLEKFPGQAYRISDGSFTTCLCETGPPTWKISAEQIDLRREGEAVIRGGTFYLLDVPVLYIPYAYFPVRTERQTGFLFPTIGSSNREGFKFQQPFFWAITKSADATFTADLETRARAGLMGELRTIFSREAQGQINLSYFNEALRKGEKNVGDPNIADTGIPKNRWSVTASHRQGNPLGWRTYSDIAAFSDDLFVREIDAIAWGPVDLGSRRYTPSKFGFFRGWEDVQLRGEWGFYQDFIQDDKRTLQKTPQLLVAGRHVLGPTPLELRWRAEGINYLRREGADGFRMDLRPELGLPFRLAPYLFGAFDLALRETYYHLYQNERTFDRNKSRELMELRGKIGTSVGRVFRLDWESLKGIRHVIEPEVNYLFVPRTQHRDIPIFDTTDRINRRNVVTFALTNRFWGKFAQPPVGLVGDKDTESLTSTPVADIREMARLKLALSYDVDKERKGGDTLSDLDIGLRLTPLDYLALGFDTGLNPGPWQVTQAAVVFSITDPRPITRRVLDRDFMRPNQLDMSYRFIRRGFLAELADNANLTTLTPERLIDRNVLSEVGAHALFHLTDHLLLLYDATFNARDRRFTSNRGVIKILSPCECWTLAFSVSSTTNPSKTSFKFDFNLLGLSSQSKELLR